MNPGMAIAYHGHLGEKCSTRATQFGRSQVTICCGRPVFPNYGTKRYSDDGDDDNDYGDDT